MPRILKQPIPRWRTFDIYEWCGDEYLNNGYERDVIINNSLMYPHYRLKNKKIETVRAQDITLPSSVRALSLQ